MNSQKMAYSGCRGKIFRFTFDQFMFVESTLQRCVILFMANGEDTVPVAARTMIHGIKIHSSDYGLPVQKLPIQFTCLLR